MIHLAAPTGISIIGTYCNATLESTSIETAPYPFRFKCQVMSTGYIQLIKQKDFPAWDSGFINRKVIIYLKYTIATSVAVACSDWVATAYTGLSVSSSNVVSQAKGFFNVDQFISPSINAINFPTKSFSKRTCKTNEKCMFYGYLYPSTLYSDTPISYMTFTLPV